MNKIGSLFLLLAVTFNISCFVSKKKITDLNGFHEMAQLLNKEIPGFKERYDPKGFYVHKNRPENFFVFNLLDTTDNVYASKGAVRLHREGVYHFSAVSYRFSFSYIAVLKNGNMKIFSRLNCQKGDKIDDVIKYVKDNFKYDEGVLNRIRHYRNYGFYFKTDPQAVIQCE